MKNTIICFLILSWSSISAVEFIRNGSFEEFYALPTQPSHLNNRVIDWTSSGCPFDPTDPYSYSQHSPDYYYNSNNSYKYFIGPSGSGIHLSAKTGNAYIGMGNYEMVKQQLATYLEPNHQYIFSLYVHSGQFGSQINNWDNLVSKMVIYLSSDEIEYKDDGDCSSSETPCNSDYRELKGNNNIKVINSFNLTDVRFSNYSNEWVLIDFMFTCPDESNILGQIYYNWISIDLILNNFNQTTGLWSDCYKSYVLIDDISIIDLCDNFCISQNSVSYGYFSEGVYYPNQIPQAFGVGYVNSTYHPLQIYVTNATYIRLVIYSRHATSGVITEVYEQEYYDPSGIRDQGYSDFVVFWDGFRNDGWNPNCLSGGTAYPANLLIRGCGPEISKDFTITYTHQPNEGCHDHLLPIIQNTNISHDCCPLFANIDNVNYSTDSRIDVQNYINLGLNANVSFDANTSVKFHAGKSINIGPYFSANPTSNIELKIVPCGTQRKRNNEILNPLSRDSIINLYSNIENIEDFIVSPNPTTGEIELLFSKPESDFKILVSDSYGKILFNINNKEEKYKNINFNLTGYQAGIYFLTVRLSNSMSTKKIIKL